MYISNKLTSMEHVELDRSFLALLAETLMFASDQKQSLTLYLR